MKTIRNSLFMLGRVAHYTPAFFFWTVVEGLVWGCIHSFTSVLFVKALFDMIEAGGPFTHILVLVGWMAAFFILAYLFHEWYWQLIEPKARQTLHERMQADLFKKAKDLDLACYEQPGFLYRFCLGDKRSRQPGHTGGGGHGQGYQPRDFHHRYHRRAADRRHLDCAGHLRCGGGDGLAQTLADQSPVQTGMWK